MPDFQRARSAAAKQLRESAILDAARVLGAERGIRQITLTEIAAAVGMHKSALLRYFETREEIFLRLTADGWREWSAALRKSSRTRGAGARGRGGRFRQDARGPRVVLRSAGAGAAQPGAERLPGDGPRLQARHPHRGGRDRGGGPAAAAGTDRAGRHRPHRGRHRDGRRVLADGHAAGPRPRPSTAATLSWHTPWSTSSRASRGCSRPCWRGCAPGPRRSPRWRGRDCGGAGRRSRATEGWPGDQRAA